VDAAKKPVSADRVRRPPPHAVAGGPRGTVFRTADYRSVGLDWRARVRARHIPAGRYGPAAYIRRVRAPSGFTRRPHDRLRHRAVHTAERRAMSFNEKLVLLLVCTAAAMVSCQVPGFGGCPDFDSQPDFDMNRVSVGLRLDNSSRTVFVSYTRFRVRPPSDSVHRNDRLTSGRFSTYYRLLVFILSSYTILQSAVQGRVLRVSEFSKTEIVLSAENVKWD